MIAFEEINIKRLEDYDRLMAKINETHIDIDTLNRIKKNVGLNADTVLVEYPYYDSEYLSNYYAHYSQKFRHYDKACYRLHFEVGENYIGCMVLRPTLGDTKMGKTFLDPKYLLHNDAYLILGINKMHIYGQEQKIECFPWKKQETDISCCAHTATWTILKYFGNKYSNYMDTTIGSIVEKVQNDWGRKTPTIGLTPSQVSDIFKSYDYSPVILAGKNIGLMDEILAYIESGIPMVGFLNLAPNNHAVSIVGHGAIDYGILNNNDTINQLVDPRSGVILHTKLINTLYVMDDRLFPYVEIPKGLAEERFSGEYGLAQLDFVVVPLYSRMQFSYREVYNRMIAWLKKGELDFGVHPICRIYITSTNSLKREALQNEEMDLTLKGVLLSLSMPRFVWCIDFADKESYMAGKTSGRIIVDTTSATSEWNPWILRHDAHRIQYKDYDENCTYVIKQSVKPYKLYVNNLKYVSGGRGDDEIKNRV